MRKAVFLSVWPLLALAATRAFAIEYTLDVRHEGHGEDTHEAGGTASTEDEEEHDHAAHALDDHHQTDHAETDHNGNTHNAHTSQDSHSHSSASSKADAASIAVHNLAHHHGSHAQPNEVLDDDDIHFWHSFPPTYLAADFKLDKDSAIFGEEFGEDWSAESEGGRKGLIVLHVIAMCLAYFGALPLSLALRAADHPSHYLANAVFLVITLVGWLSGTWYKAATPDRYEGEVHSSMGNLLVLTSLGLSLLDSLGLLKRAVAWWRRTRTSKGERRWSVFVHDALRVAAGATSLDRAETYTSPSSHAPLMDYMGYDRRQSMYHEEADRHVVFALGEDEDHEHIEQPSQHEEGWNSRPSLSHRLSPTYRSSRTSTGSDGTLRDSPTSGTPPHFYKMFSSEEPQDVPQIGAYNMPGSSLEASEEGGGDAEAISLHDDRNKGDTPSGKMTILRFGEICLTWIRRLQVVLAYVVVLSGFAIYTGMCRASYINSCAAHYIKGSIFFGYGVITFARYIGAYADLGWSWNRAPSGYTGPSAEMVECAVIFTYGLTNTWMERFGAKAGDPYSVKQVQHISIAVMFWFAGLSGMLLESKTIKRLLASSVVSTGHAQPRSYTFSFNPLPALVIAVTGLAMAAHHQDYVFQVQIHSLWGILLAGGSLFRLITYTFLWLRPPVDSTLPSRPPTEILAAFGWATGGIVFILSSEEIMFAAMRAGYDDMMAFLNVTVALTALVFCWEVIVLGVKGWGVSRVKGKGGNEGVGVVGTV